MKQIFNNDIITNGNIEAESFSVDGKQITTNAVAYGSPRVIASEIMPIWDGSTSHKRYIALENGERWDLVIRDETTFYDWLNGMHNDCEYILIVGGYGPNYTNKAFVTNRRLELPSGVKKIKGANGAQIKINLSGNSASLGGIKAGSNTEIDGLFFVVDIDGTGIETEQTININALENFKKVNDCRGFVNLNSSLENVSANIKLSYNCKSVLNSQMIVGGSTNTNFSLISIDVYDTCSPVFNSLAEIALEFKLKLSSTFRNCKQVLCCDSTNNAVMNGANKYHYVQCSHGSCNRATGNGFITSNCTKWDADSCAMGLI